MFRHLPFVVKNTLRNRRRSLLTILSIAASLCLLGVLMALYHAFFFTEATPEQALRLITRNRVSIANVMPMSYKDKIRAVDGVREVMVMQWYGGVYKDARDMKNFFGRFAVEPEQLFTMYTEYRIPEDQKQAFLRERTACVMGRPLADRLGLKIGDRITLMGDIFPGNLEFILRGIYDARRDNENMFFHHKYLMESLPAGRRDFAGTFMILADSPQSVPRIAQTVDEMFRNATQQTKTDTEKAFELSFLSYLGNVKLFLLSICGALTFTILLVSANTMAMSVRERVREVGILKTLGYTPGAILGIILAEAVTIALIGGVIGLGLASLICGALRQSPTTFVDLKALEIPVSVGALCLLVAALVGLLSCAVPAWSASRRSIIDSLRFTD